MSCSWLAITDLPLGAAGARESGRLKYASASGATYLSDCLCIAHIRDAAMRSDCSAVNEVTAALEGAKEAAAPGGVAKGAAGVAAEGVAEEAAGVKEGPVEGTAQDAVEEGGEAWSEEGADEGGVR